MRRRADVVACGIAGAALLGAGPEGRAEDRLPTVQQTESLTLNAAALGYGIGELRWEHRLGTAASASAIAGVGRGSALAGFQNLWLVQGGAQLRGWLTGGFDEGLGIALELVYLRMLGERSAERGGLAVSPRLVYKVAHRAGPTAEVQVGGAMVLRSAVPLGGGAAVSDVQGQAVVSLGLGWSF